MKKVGSTFLGSGVMLAVLLLSSSAFADTFTTPWGSSAVEIYMGWRTDVWTGGHSIIWKRKSDGKCKRFDIPHGHNYVIGGSKDDLIKVQWADEPISCLGETFRLGPFVPNTVMLHLKGGSGHDTILTTEPVWDAKGENGNDLLVVVDNAQVVLDGGRGSDTLESWSTSNSSELYGGDDDDCLWIRSPLGLPFYFSGGPGNDQCNGAIFGEAACETQVSCCAFGAFMGVCQP